jgi:hypothetical protein
MVLGYSGGIPSLVEVSHFFGLRVGALSIGQRTNGDLSVNVNLAE